MACTVSFNGYSFPVETTVPVVSKSYERDTKGRLARERQQWTIRSVLQADGDAAIDALVAALESALLTSANPQDDPNTVTLYLSSGGSSSHSLSNAIVDSITYPEGTGPEFANRRTVEVTVSGDADVTRADNIISFSETVNYGGGGSRYIMLTTLTGRPRRYRSTKYTPYTATQSGSVVSEDSYTAAPAPLFPGHEVDENPNLTAEPIYTGDGQLRYKTTWSYQFASARPLREFPNTWL